MSAFEFMFSFYGLLLGLTLVEVVSGFSRALDRRDERPMGRIMPLLTAVMIMDIATQWGSAWRDYREVEFSFRYLVGAVLMTLAYYFAATQLFPRERSSVVSLDDHFFKHRNTILGGVLVANVIVTVDQMTRYWIAAGADVVFWTRLAANAFWFSTILIPLFTRDRRVIVGALGANLIFIIYWLLR